MNQEGWSLVEISGMGCAACEALAFSAGEAAARLGIAFFRLDIDTCGALPADWHIERVPALVLAREGRMVCVLYGYQPPEILGLYLEDRLNACKKEKNV